jgi:hypothetical protein
MPSIWLILVGLVLTSALFGWPFGMIGVVGGLLWRITPGTWKAPTTPPTPPTRKRLAATVLAFRARSRTIGAHRQGRETRWSASSDSRQTQPVPARGTHKACRLRRRHLHKPARKDAKTPLDLGRRPYYSGGRVPQSHKHAETRNG